MAENKTKLPPKRPTAQKRDIQNKKKHLLNKAFKSKVKTALKTFLTLNGSKDEKTKESLNEVYALYDKGVKKGVFHLKKASRDKSKLAKKVAI